MKNIQVKLTLICASLLAITLLFLTEPTEEKEASYYDCPDRVSIPVAGITTFAWCADNNTVWIGDEWVEPTNIEQRRIDIYLNHQNQNQ